jgi:predicted membrane metal-binding protein
MRWNYAILLSANPLDAMQPGGASSFFLHNCTGAHLPDKSTPDLYSSLSWPRGRTLLAHAIYAMLLGHHRSLH